MNLDNSHHTFRKTTKRKRPLRTLALVHLAIATEYCASAFVPSDTCVQKFLYQQTKRKDVALCSSRKPSDTYYNDEDDFPGRQTPSPRYPRPPLDYSDPLPPKKSSSNQAPSQERFRRIDEPSKDPIQRYPPQRRPDPSGSRFDDEDEYYDDDQYYDDGDYYDDYDYVEDEEEEVTGGNYWSNPPARYDEVRKPKRRVPRPDDPPRVRSTRPSRTRPGSSGNTR